jgi:hypothetical protein
MAANAELKRGRKDEEQREVSPEFGRWRKSGGGKCAEEDPISLQGCGEKRRQRNHRR